MRTDTPHSVYLKDYRAPAYVVRHVDLSFQIYDDKTVVTSKLEMEQVSKTRDPLLLDGERLILKSIVLDGKKTEYTLTDKGMTIPSPGKRAFVLEIVTEIDPAGNTALEGLYKSGGTYCTQCEAEGFRKITYYLDRPDVMATFRVRIEADKASCPVLLSNGNLIGEGSAEANRHFALWDDPTPKPCYLFALVAGDLVYIQDLFMTMRRRPVDLRIYVRKGDQAQCSHAMASLKHSMRWDEDVYGREYQYNSFNIVAVSDFNMGAMENTSLNIFNTALVLAHPETATDSDFQRVESVVAHEYFHNWTGNRITCRDWFQLSLKEGLTVFRDQEFSADMGSPAVQRIDDVTHLRRLQFPEDAGPLAHPIRPDNYIEINNFYTMTVYEKGAEVIRMMRTLLGKEKYRKATDLYFDRHDGQAVTCDDFVKCMEDSSNLNLTQFKLWYVQAGTPEVFAQGEYDEEKRTYTLRLRQTLPATPGQPIKRPMHIPVAVGLVGPNGSDMDLGGGETTKILDLKDPEQEFVFKNIGARPVPSILRNFSAPVKLTTNLTDHDLRFLMAHDGDGFNRWEAGQTLALRVMNEMIDHLQAGRATTIDPSFLESYDHLLRQADWPETDQDLLARALSLPDIPIIAQQRPVVDPDHIYSARKQVMDAIAMRYGSALRQIHKFLSKPAPFSTTRDAMAGRALKNIALSFLDDADLAKAQYDSATNMTDRVAALAVLADKDWRGRDTAFEDFYVRFQNYPLVIDKWFSLQASAVRKDVLLNLEELKKHPDFTLKNPNRVRSLYASFAMNNPVRFHAKDGSGYIFLRDAVMELNSINPQIAARLLTPLREWRRYTQGRQAKMKAVLQKIANLPNLSPDVFEIVSKSLQD